MTDEQFKEQWLINMAEGNSVMELCEQIWERMRADEKAAERKFYEEMYNELEN